MKTKLFNENKRLTCDKCNNTLPKTDFTQFFLSIESLHRPGEEIKCYIYRSFSHVGV